MNVTVEEVEERPHEYLHRVLEGETLVLFREERAVAEIRPLSIDYGKRPIGLAKGEFSVPDDFDEPLPNEVLEQFEGKRGCCSIRTPSSGTSRKIRDSRRLPRMPFGTNPTRSSSVWCPCGRFS